jgi:translocation and assembly module TamB
VLGRDEIMAILSGTITAEGSLKTLNVRGALRSDRVEVDLDTGLPPSVVTLDVTEIPADQGAGTQKVAVRNKPEEPKDEESFASEILLDIKLDLPGQVFVRGHGLDSEWEGNISVAGNAAKPRVTGQLTSRRGRIDFIEKSFTLESSTIDLAPKADGSVDALLNIKAVNESNDLTVTVTVSGTATSPSIALSANPAMPQDEILSRLLFGKNRASLSPIEAVQLAQALRSLSGGGGPSMMTRLRRMLGVDVLRVDSGNGSDSSPSLEAGKYVTDKVYVGVKQGASQGSSAVAVDVDVLKNMSVGTEIRQDGTNQVGVKYKWDY